MVGCLAYSQLLIELHKGTGLPERNNQVNSKKLSQWTSSYLDDQSKQCSMDCEPAQLMGEIGLLDEPLATAETISFQLEREKKKAMTTLEEEDSKLKKVGCDRLALDSDDTDDILANFFGKIDFKSHTQSLCEPMDNEESSYESNLCRVVAERSARLSEAASTANPPRNALPVPMKKMLLKHMKTDIKSTNSEIINTKLYLRRMDH